MPKMLDSLGVEQDKIVSNGQDAVAYEAQRDNDVILMDMQMPVPVDASLLALAAVTECR